LREHDGRCRPLRQQCRGFRGSQTHELEFVETGHVRLHRAFPAGQQKQHRVVPHPAGREQQDDGRFPIDPLQVVDQDENRPFLGGHRQHRDCGDADQEPPGRRFTGRPAHGGLQRRSLRWWKLCHPVAQGSEELGQTCVADGDLGGHPGGAQPGEPRCGFLGRGQQGGLADTGCSGDTDAGPTPVPGILQCGSNDREFGLSPDEHGPEFYGAVVGGAVVIARP
jgi:hypothetical protein